MERPLPWSDHGSWCTVAMTDVSDNGESILASAFTRMSGPQLWLAGTDESGPYLDADFGYKYRPRVRLGHLHLSER